MRIKSLFFSLTFLVSTTLLFSQSENQPSLQNHQISSPLMMLGGEEEKNPTQENLNSSSMTGRGDEQREAAAGGVNENASTQISQGTRSGLAEEGEDEGALTLDHFRAALDQYPEVSRFVIVKNNETFSIEPGDVVSGNRTDNLDIIDALRAALEKKESFESRAIVSEVIGQNNLLTYANSHLSAARLREILLRFDTAQKTAFAAGTISDSDNYFISKNAAEVNKSISLIEGHISTQRKEYEVKPSNPSIKAAPKKASFDLTIQALHVFLNHSLESANRCITGLQFDAVAAMYSQDQSVKDAWTKIIPTAERLLKYIKNCRERSEYLNIDPRELVLVDRQEEALKLRIQVANNVANNAVRLQYSNPKSDRDKVADLIEDAAKYTVNSLHATEVQAYDLAHALIHAGTHYQTAADYRVQSKKALAAGDQEEADRLNEEALSNENKAYRFSRAKEEFADVDKNNALDLEKSSQCLAQAETTSIAGDDDLARALAHAPTYYQLAVDYRIQSKKALAAGDEKEADRLNKEAQSVRYIANTFAGAKEKFADVDKNNALDLDKASQSLAQAETTSIAGDDDLASALTHAATYFQTMAAYRTQSKKALAAGDEKEADRLNKEAQSVRYIANRFAKAKEEFAGIDKNIAFYSEKASEFLAQAETTSIAGDHDLASALVDVMTNYQLAVDYRIQLKKALAAGDEKAADSFNKQVECAYQTARGLTEIAQDVASYLVNASEYTTQAEEARAAGHDEEANLFTQAAVIRRQTAAEYINKVRPLDFKKINETSYGTRYSYEILKIAENTRFKAKNADEPLIAAAKYVHNATEASSRKNHEEADLWSEAARQSEEVAKYILQPKEDFTLKDRENIAEHFALAAKYSHQATKAKTAKNNEEALLWAYLSKKHQAAAAKYNARFNQTSSSANTTTENNTRKADSVGISNLYIFDDAFQYFITASAGSPGYKFWNQAVVHIKNMLEYLDKGTKADVLKNQKVATAWIKAANAAEVIAANFIEAAKYKKDAYELIRPGSAGKNEESQRCRQKANEAYKIARELTKVGIAEAKKAMTTQSSLKKLSLSAEHAGEITVAKTVSSAETTFCSTELVVLSSLPLAAIKATHHNEVQSAMPAVIIASTEAAVNRLSNLESRMVDYSAKAHEIGAPGAKVWKQGVAQINAAIKYRDKAIQARATETRKAASTLDNQQKAERLMEAAHYAMNAAEGFALAAQKKKEAVEFTAAGNPQEAQRCSAAAEAALEESRRWVQSAEAKAKER